MKIIHDVVSAWVVPGSHPEHHSRMRMRLSHDWPVLAQALARLSNWSREKGVEQVWSVAYESDVPTMSGRKHRIRATTEFKSLHEAEQAYVLIKERSRRSEKKNLRIETRWVTPWEEEVWH